MFQEGSTIAEDQVQPAAAVADPDAEVRSRLTRLWKQYRGRGLEVRHQTGLLLNQRFGGPQERQKYGAAKLKEYSTLLNVALSDLSRMRWFAHRFPTLDDLRKGHPGVKTWTQVKPLPAELRLGEKPPAAPDGRQGMAGPGRGPVRIAMKSLEAFRDGLAGLTIRPGDPELTPLAEAFEDLLADFAKCTGVRYVRASNEAPPIHESETPRNCFGGAALMNDLVNDLVATGPVS